MSKVTKDTFNIFVEPHDLADIRGCIIQKLDSLKGTYIHEKQYYLDSILKLLEISPCGMISRTNHLISFQVTAMVSFVRPCVGDVVTGTVSSVIKHGTFVQTSLYTSIVPTPQKPDAHPSQHQVGDIVSMRIDDVKFSAKHIYTISSILDNRSTLDDIST
jgi:DNA-directed RNA polymerase subunit E'/Rpb7